MQVSGRHQHLTRLRRPRRNSSHHSQRPEIYDPRGTEYRIHTVSMHSRRSSTGLKVCGLGMATGLGLCKGIRREG